MRTAVKAGSNLDEVLQTEPLKDDWAKIWGEEDSENQAAGGGGLATMGSTPVQLVSGATEHPLADKVAKAAVTLTTSVSSAVGSLISTMPVCEDSNSDLKSLKSLAESLRSLPVFKMKATDSTSVLLLYEVDGAGEHESCPRRSGTPIRKNHLDLVISAAMLARSESSIEDMVQEDTWDFTPSVSDV